MIYIDNSACLLKLRVGSNSVSPDLFSDSSGAVREIHGFTRLSGAVPRELVYHNARMKSILL
jgi:hypothetical protein